MKQIDYAEYAATWKDFFISKGFCLHYADECGGIFQSFRGCQPQLRADVYAGEYRNNTVTGGCICVDFSSLFDKVSKCPIYFDLNESQKTVWKAIEMLMVAGKDFSNNFGRIIKQRGGLEYSPDIHNIKTKTECRRRYNAD